MQALSTELVVLVFKFTTGVDSLDDSTWRPHYRQLRKFALVSKYWKAIVYGTPSFWAFLPYNASQRILNWLLQMSGSCPLHISGSSATPRSEKAKMHRRLQRMARLAVYSDRWKSLELGAWPENRDFVEEMLRVPLPQLEYLSIDFSTLDMDLERRRIAPVFPPTRSIPTLRSLKFTNLEPTWNLCGHSLRSLAIHYTRHFPLQTLIEALQASPHLENLELEFFEPMAGEQPNEVPRETIAVVMPYLRNICLHTLPSDTDHILSHLRLPTLTSIIADISDVILTSTDRLTRASSTSIHEPEGFVSRLLEIVSSSDDVFAESGYIQSHMSGVQQLRPYFALGLWGTPVLRVSRMVSLLEQARPGRVVWRNPTTNPSDLRSIPNLACIVFDYHGDYVLQTGPSDIYEMPHIVVGQVLGTYPPDAFGQLRQVVINYSKNQLSQFMVGLRGIEQSSGHSHLNLDVVVLVVSDLRIPENTSQFESDVEYIRQRLGARDALLYYEVSKLPAIMMDGFNKWLQSLS